MSLSVNGNSLTFEEVWFSKYFYWRYFRNGCVMRMRQPVISAHAQIQQFRKLS